MRRDPFGGGMARGGGAPAPRVPLRLDRFQTANTGALNDGNTVVFEVVSVGALWIVQGVFCSIELDQLGLQAAPLWGLFQDDPGISGNRVASMGPTPQDSFELPLGGQYVWPGQTVSVKLANTSASTVWQVHLYGIQQEQAA